MFRLVRSLSIEWARFTSLNWEERNELVLKKISNLRRSYLIGGLWVVRVLVWVVFEGQLPVCLLDVVGRGRLGQTERLVQRIAGCAGVRKKRNRQKIIQLKGGPDLIRGDVIKRKRVYFSR